MAEAAMEEDAGASVQIRFSTKDPLLEIESRPLLVPTSLKRYGLSEIINHLLETPAPIPFSFLIQGTLLNTSVQEYLTKAGLSSESVLEVEYVRSILPPSFLASFPHDDWISAIAVSQQQQQQQQEAEIVTGAYDGAVRIWSQSQTCLAVGTGHTLPIKTLALMGARIVSGSMDGTLRLWDRQAAAAGTTSSESLVCAAELRGHGQSIASCDVHGTQHIVSGAADGTIGVWDTTDTLTAPHTSASLNRRKRQRGTGHGVLRPRHLFDAHHAAPITQVAFAKRDAATLYSTGWDHALVTTDLTTLLPLSTITTSTSLHALLELDALRVVLSGGERSIGIHDLRSNQLTRSSLTGHTSFVVALSRAPNQDYLFASASHDGTVRVWDMRNETALYTIARHPITGRQADVRSSSGNKVLAVDWADIGIVSGGEDCQLQINRGVDQSAASTTTAKI